MSPANRTTQLSPPSAQAGKEVRRDSPLRRARTCYDHLAGVAGVELMGALLREGWLEEQGESKGQSNGRTHYRLTPVGEQALTRRGVDLSPPAGSKRMYAYGCVDWTERRFHLGGALGAAALRSLAEAGMVRRDSGTRVVACMAPVSNWVGGIPG